jgi:hypothetical protein
MLPFGTDSLRHPQAKSFNRKGHKVFAKDAKSESLFVNFGFNPLRSLRLMDFSFCKNLNNPNTCNDQPYKDRIQVLRYNQIVP